MKSITKSVKKSVWMGLMAWMVGCGSAAAPTPEPGERWELVDAPKPPDRSQFKPKDDQPLYFPPGSLPWQPKDTPILVHTGLGHDTHTAYDERIRAMSNYGLKVKSLLATRIGGYELLPRDSNERTWIALDLPEMRFRGALHFFELVAGKQDGIITGQYGSFIWNPSPGFWLMTEAADRFVIYIDALPGRRIRPGLDEGTTRTDPPQVPSPWVELATRCLKIDCPFDIFIWKPEADLFFTVKGYFNYFGADPLVEVYPFAGVGDLQRR